jgi:predicted DCC family thiol-disulfide oxidoreductase YuxK
MGVNQSQEPRGWVLYDDYCGFCRWWIPFWADTLRRQGLAIAPLQTHEISDRLRIPDQQLLDDLRILLRDGTHIAGADVYRFVMQKVWWAKPFYWLSIVPLSRNVFDWGYRTFANNRYQFSAVCGWSPDRQPKRTIGYTNDNDRKGA